MNARRCGSTRWTIGAIDCGVRQVLDLHVIPDWWPDPRFVLKDWEKWFEVVIDEGLRQHGSLELESDKALQWDLLATDWTVLRSGVKTNGAAATVYVRDLAPGKYLLRVARDGHAAARFAPMSRGDVRFSVGVARERE